MIKSRNLDPEAGRWSDPIKLASSTTASFAFRNPTGKSILVDRVVVHVTTAAAGKSLNVGTSASATATHAQNTHLMSGGALTSGQAVSSEAPTLVVKGSYVVGTLSATDSTLVAYAYIYYKELPL